MARDWIETYRLRPQALKDYLRRLFNQEIPVTVAYDDKAFYTFNIPRKLNQDERDYIYDKLRYKEEVNPLWE
ncbi:hypothetical protein F5Y13DRAFT_101877 [Hypoxylon sp. FL1857]|nr:hypothetical protein F5Y13DRAFT_101877 [Hypoxylon sp. FL1857]